MSFQMFDLHANSSVLQRKGEAANFPQEQDTQLFKVNDHESAQQS